MCLKKGTVLTPQFLLDSGVLSSIHVNFGQSTHKTSNSSSAFIVEARLQFGSVLYSIISVCFELLKKA